MCNGINEFLIAELIEAAPAFGVGAVSLNFAMFREAIELGERIGAGRSCAPGGGSY